MQACALGDKRWKQREAEPLHPGPTGAGCSFASVGFIRPRSPGPWWAPWGGSHTPAQTNTQGDACCRTEQGASRAWECAHLVTEGDGTGDQGLPLERALWCQL